MNNQIKILFLTTRKHFVLNMQQELLADIHRNAENKQKEYLAKPLLKHLIKVEFISNKKLFKKPQDFVKKLLSNYDLIFVYSFRAIIPAYIIKFLNEKNIPLLNIHFSLLPKYPGALPIQGTLLNQDTEFGITIHKVVERVDSGDILMQIEVDHNLLGYSTFDIFSDLEKVTINLLRYILSLKFDKDFVLKGLQELFKDIPNGLVRFRYYPQSLGKGINTFGEFLTILNDSHNYKPQKTGKLYSNYAPFSLANNTKVSFVNFYTQTANEIISRVRAFNNDPIARVKADFINEKYTLLLHKIFPIDSNDMYSLGSRVILEHPAVCKAMKLLKKYHNDGLLNLNKLKPGELKFIKKIGLIAGTYFGPVYIYKAGLENKKILSGVELLSLKGKLVRFIAN